MEFLRFIFSSFWVWLGFVVLVAAAGGAVVEIVKAIRPARKIAVYRTGDVVRVEAAGIFRRRLKPQRSGTRRTRNERGIIEQ